MSRMSEPLALSLGQKFELERMTRMIDSTGDPQSLRGLAKQLLQAWHTQKAATEWIMRQQLGTPSQFGGLARSAAVPSRESSSQPNVNGSMDVL
ncbi:MULTISPECIES: hypothetical protein [unclassified Synechococcus]|uniref:hypothetical protein n=1 Tax=unclassified Synechococcus TaxID=2626047 RepID=UPI0026216E11|nr:MULTISPECIES: hypothetical protein [unclassified Synechococcus]WFN59017.1 hypothetical protein N4320_14825 [Synechococcus sp. CCFWC 502]